MTFPNVFNEANLARTQTLKIRQGDRLPQILAQVVDEFGVPQDLTGKTAYLSVQKELSGNGAGSWGLSVQALIIDPVKGQISYDFQESDTADSDPGVYELIVTIYDISTDEIEYSAPTNRDTYIALSSRARLLKPGRLALTTEGRSLTFDNEYLTVKDTA